MMLVILWMTVAALAQAPGSQTTAQTTAGASELSTARELLEKPDLPAAEVAARRFIAAHPSDSSGHFLLGLIYFREVQSMARATGTYTAPGDVPPETLNSDARDEKVRASLAEFTEGAKFGKPSSFDLKIVSFDYVLLSDYASADKWLSIAVEWEPQDADAWYYLGRAKYNENRFEEAVHAFQNAIEFHPRHVLAADGIGLSYAGLNRTAEAVSWLQTSIAWQEGAPQKSPEPYIDLGDLLNQLAKFEEALPILQQAVTIAPRNIRAHETLGKTMMNLNRLPEAQKELEASLAVDPNRSAAHYLLGQIYRKQGQLEKAKAEMARFQELKAKDPPPKSGMQ
ncbi:MAG TPA: tetratricopeptide repeat protein [Candidatus Acidoferrum sp.]|nr:tetratricopeptide repeat protein [Candidatus Acidoferrum sp.]